jgi:hypothetical protein
MDETMDLSTEFDINTQSKEVASKLIDKVQKEIVFEDSTFTEDEFVNLKNEVIDIFADSLGIMIGN